MARTRGLSSSAARVIPQRDTVSDVSVRALALLRSSACNIDLTHYFLYAVLCTASMHVLALLHSNARNRGLGIDLTLHTGGVPPSAIFQANLQV